MSNTASRTDKPKNKALRAVPPRINDTLTAWTRQAMLIQVLHIGLVSTAVITSVLTAAGVPSKVFGLNNIFAAVSAIAIGLVSAFDLGAKANGFRRAWRMLNVAVMRYEYDDKLTEEELFKLYESAEQQIGDVKAAAQR